MHVCLFIIIFFLFCHCFPLFASMDTPKATFSLEIGKKKEKSKHAFRQASKGSVERERETINGVQSQRRQALERKSLQTRRRSQNKRIAGGGGGGGGGGDRTPSSFSIWIVEYWYTSSFPEHSHTLIVRSSPGPRLLSLFSVSLLLLLLLLVERRWRGREKEIKTAQRFGIHYYLKRGKEDRCGLALGLEILQTVPF